MIILYFSIYYLILRLLNQDSFFAKEFNKKSSSVGFPIEELKLLIINDFLIAKFQR